MRAAKGKGITPWPAIQMGLCERLHCTPSQLAQEDIGEILRGFNLLDLYRNLKALARGETLSGDTMDRIGDALQLEVDGR